MPAKSFAIACLLGLPLAVLFAPALVGDRSLVYRDAAHYYRPLYDCVADQWGEGRVPLWNPWEDLGRPLAGDPTAAVFYPGKLIYCLPLAPARRYHLYLFAHAWLAACGAYVLARGWGVSRGGALLAGWSYSLSGAVLFQAVNVIFLVGAAWLPLAMLVADRALTRRCYRWAVLLGAILALIVLGGDAQLAYTMGLLSVVYALFLWRAPSSVKQAWLAVPAEGARPALLGSRPVLLLAAGASAAVLCSVQLVASYAWVPQTVRATTSQPANVYQAASMAMVAEVGQGRIEPFRTLLERPPPGTPTENTYDFSVGPWHWPELLWPGMSGRISPQHTRWSEAFPSETRTWVPSLYLGLVPLLLALVATRWRGRKVATPIDFHRRWLTWVAMAALLLALGRYGMGWAIEQLRLTGSGGAGEPIALADHAGGPYWLVKLLVPGYASFRYPAKLLVFFSLAMSLLAGFGWQRLWEQETVRTRRQLLWLLGGVVGVSVVAYAGTYLLRGWWNGWMRTVRADDLFGPLDAAAALGELRWALIHGLLVSAIALVLLWRPGKMASHVTSGLLLAMCAIELTFAQRPLLEFVPSELFVQPAAFAEHILESQNATGGEPNALPPRVYRASDWAWRPSAWAESGSPNRPAAGLAWDRGTLLPKYPLGERMGVVSPGGSFSDANLESLLEAAQRHGLRWGEGFWEPGPEVFEALGVEYLAMPEDLPLLGTSESGTRLDRGELAAAVLWQLDPPPPRLWISHRWMVEPLSPQPAVRLGQFESRYFQLGDPQWRTVAWLEEPPRERKWENVAIPKSESCEVVTYAPARVELKAELTEPGVLVLAEQYAPGWHVSVDTYKLHSELDETHSWEPEVLRVHGALRGIWLPAGTHKIELRYIPRGFTPALLLTLAGWITLVVFLAATLVRGRNRPALPAEELPKSSA